jgi:hypothetical protein
LKGEKACHQGDLAVQTGLSPKLLFIPTLEYNGKWREGKEFNPFGLDSDLKKLGIKR